MSLPPMLDHDTTGYQEILDRITVISRAWGSTRARMRAQLVPLTQIWEELRDDPARALPRAMVAHLIADLQTDPADELRWDRESLRCLAPVWEQVHDPRLFDAGRRCLPSIYLSLAGASRRCGELAAAHEYLRRARLLAPVLTPGRYADHLIGTMRQMERDLDAR